MIGLGTCARARAGQPPTQSWSGGGPSRTPAASLPRAPVVVLALQVLCHLQHELNAGCLVLNQLCVRLRA